MTDQIVAIARSWIGTPYRHQASCKGAGTDCLGLVRGIWRELYGDEPQDIPGYTMDWLEPARDDSLWRLTGEHLVEQPSVAPTNPGDVLLFRLKDRGVAKHFAVVAQGRQSQTIIHAYSGHAVVETALTRPWARRAVARFMFPKKD